MKRFIASIAVLLAVVLVVAATLPFWLGAALGAAGKSRGLQFGGYERQGYSRFALTDVTYRREGTRVDVARVEADTPLVWLFKKWRGKPGHLVATSWRVDVEPRREGAAQAPGSDHKFGARDLHSLLVKLAPRLDRWLQVAEVGEGGVTWSGGGLKLESATWKESSLSVKSLTIAGLTGDVAVTFPAPDSIRAQGQLADGTANIDLASTGNNLGGEIHAWDQTATITSQFAPTGWLPGTASLVASDWTIPASLLKLGEAYTSVGGSVKIDWRGNGFIARIDAKGTPREGSDAPPLHVDVDGHGDRESVDVARLSVGMPGVNAVLSAPVKLDWHGRMLTGGSTFTLAADLGKQPWFKGGGTLKGQARLTQGEDGIPRIEANLEGNQFAFREWSLPSARADAVLEWPALKLHVESSGTQDDRKFEAQGVLNLETRELADATVQGTIDDEAVRFWLPGGIGFAKATVDATAHGPLRNLQHSGTASASGLQLPGVHPMDADLEWHGEGAVVDVTSARFRASESEVVLAGHVDATGGRIDTLEFTRRGEKHLALESPATLRWNRSLEAGPFKLTGAEGSVAGSVVWGREGKVELSARNFAMLWLADYVTLPDIWSVLRSFDGHGSWDDGPMAFDAKGELALAIGLDTFASVSVSARSDGGNLEIENARVTAGDAPVFTAHGELPIRLHPYTGEVLRIEPGGTLKLTASSAASPEFWGKMHDLTGLELIDPDVGLELNGTWDNPRGEVRAKATRVAADPKRFKFQIPRVEALDLQATVDSDQVSLERLSLEIEDQAMRAEGRLKLGPGKWPELLADPWTVLKEAVDLHVEIPDAQIAGLKTFTAPYLAPEGRLKLNATLKAGGEIDGTLNLRGASSRPLGPLGILQEISADVSFNGREALLENVSARAGGQPVTLTGKIGLPEGRGPAFDLSLKGTNLPFARRSGLLVRGDLDLKLATADDGVPVIRGTTRLRDSLYLSDIRALLPGGGQGPSRRPPYFSVESAPMNSWRLAVDVQGDRFLRLRTTLFNGVASARFKLGGTLGDPRAIGSATVNEGQVLLPFATFDVTQCSVQLAESEPYRPKLALVGTSRLYGYDLHMEVSGTANDPVVTFTSSPPLVNDEVVALVMAGEPPRNGQEFASGAGRYARLGTYLGRDLLKNLGGDASDLDRLTITSGAQISRLGRETYEIEYSLGRRFSLAGEYDEFDEFNGGVKWHFFSERPKRDESRKEGGSTAAAKQAEISVSGLGLLGNRVQKRSLERLLGDQWGETLGTGAIEDASILLLSAVGEEGFLKASLSINVTGSDGEVRNFEFDSTLSTVLPRNLQAKSVELRVTKGVRYFVDKVTITGLTAIKGKLARSYFRPNAFLLRTESERAYTQGRMARATDRLLDELRKLGYAEAVVHEPRISMDDKTGRVSVAIEVEEGRRWTVSSIETAGVGETGVVIGTLDKFTGQPWSRVLQEDLSEAVRRAFYDKGYPDVTVALSTREQSVHEGVKQIGVTVSIAPGPLVHAGEVRFEGDERTKPSVLRRAVVTKAGEPLDPVDVEQTRHRLARLGVFDSVESQVEPADGTVRDTVFVLKDAPRWSGNLLFGYGSYERFRLGATIRQNNLFGLAHQGRIDLVQSMKSSRGELSYTVPELFGEYIDGTARLFGLQRQETSFVRTETGVNVSLSRVLKRISGEAAVGYTFQSLRNRDNELGTAPIDNQDVTAGSLDFGIVSDFRDNPLRPRRGFRVSARLENAMKALGGESNYQRLVVGASYHTSVGQGGWIHAGFSHGVVTTLGSEDDSLLPVNKRFFPGGDSSIRGYQNGEASPRDADGRFIGAKTYMQLNLEFEQALTGNWSVVAFADGVGVAARLADYPFDERLYSVGAGVRYNTIIGPIRLEYGHNLNPREGDPGGTLHFSVGFPF